MNLIYTSKGAELNPDIMNGDAVCAGDTVMSPDGELHTVVSVNPITVADNGEVHPAEPMDLCAEWR